MRRETLAAASIVLAIGILTLTGCPGTATLGDTSTIDDNTTDGTDTVPGGTREIEPDDFEEGEALTLVDDRITLHTTTSDNKIVELFTVTATSDDNTATGEKVFGHSEIPFWNNERRLRIDFRGAGSTVTLVFINGEAFDASIARMEAYDEDGNLLDEYVTKAIQPGESEEMSVEGGGFAYVIAYLADGDGSFGRFDLLTFSATTTSSAQEAR